MAECLFNDTGVLRDGVIQVDGGSAFADSAANTDADWEPIITAAFNTCHSIGSEGKCLFSAENF